MTRPPVRDFWLLTDQPAWAATAEQLTARAEARIPTTPDCPNSKRGAHSVWPEIKWPLPVSWWILPGLGTRRYGDFNAINLPFGFVVGERVRDLIEKNALKGFVFRDIRMVKHRPLRDQAFAPEEVQGKFWVLDAELTLSLSFGPSHPVEVKRMCDVCGWTEVAFPRRGKLSVEPNGWDGHDAFRVRYLDEFAVSSRFRKLVRAARLTLIEFVPLLSLGSAEVREEYKGPVEERVRGFQIEAQRYSEPDAGPVDLALYNEAEEYWEKHEKENVRRAGLMRRRLRRALRNSDYGYLD